MKVEIPRMCRGDGAAYFYIKVHKSASNTRINVEAFSGEGVQLPHEGYDVGSYDELFQAVYVIPLLSIKKVHFTITENDESGAQIAQQKREFSMFRLKWESRFWYKADKSISTSIRDIEKYTFARQIHVRPLVLAETPEDDDGNNEIIFKGIVGVPEGDEGMQLVLLNEVGEPIESADFYIGAPVTVEAYGMTRIDVPFTVRIPNNKKTYCIYAKSSKGNKGGFLCFTQKMKSQLIVDHDPHFYKISCNELYEIYSSRRKRNIDRIEPNPPTRETPLFSLVVPLFRTPPQFLREMVASVKNQVLGDWELVLANASPEDEVLAAELEKLEQEGDSRIKVIRLEGNEGISKNTNAAIEVARGDYIALFDHDDLLDPMVLFEYAKVIEEKPETDVLYCDEDFLTEEGEFRGPHFKSDFNLDLLRSHNYITHLLCVRATLLKEFKLRSEFDGAQDYDLVLRLAEYTKNFQHVPEVLYHWRVHSGSTAKSSDNKSYAEEAGRAALQDYLDRQGIDAKALLTDSACYYRVDYAILGEPLISIIIPNKDNSAVLRRCIESVQNLTDYRNFEIIVVENNSTQPETFEYYEQIQKQFDNVRVVFWEEKGFNYSAINNFGAQHAQGEYLLLLNNDTEVIQGDWLGSMLSYCQRPEVGIVGAKLLFPDNSIQHAGVMFFKCNTPAEAGGPIHIFSHLDAEDVGYMRRVVLAQNVSAVTAACLLVSKAVFDQVDGFDEDFAVAYNDVDFCVRVGRAGYLIVYDPHAVLYHYESLSRGPDTVSSGKKNYARFLSEQGRLRTRWSDIYAQGDPYHGNFATKMP